MKPVFFLMCLLANCLGMEPKAPRSLTLHAEVISEIFVHERVTSVLQFSEKVTMVTGVGLTDGSTEGIVQFDHPKDSRTVVLRNLGKEGRVLMQVMVGNEVYALRLIQAEEPDSIVRLSALPPEVDAAAEKKTGLLVQPDRAEEILSLASTCFGGEVVPSLESKKVHNLWRGDGVEALVEWVARSAADDAVILKGVFRNTGSEPLEVDRLSAELLVGEVRRVPATRFQPSAVKLDPGARCEFFLLVAGDGLGARANMSIKNRFDLVLTPTSEGK